MNEKERSGTDQRSHWDETFTGSRAFFGAEPSGFAERSLPLFQRHGVRKLLELGCGQGRDTSLFAREGIEVTALDYSESAVEATSRRADEAGLSSRIHARTQDLREALPFADDSFDACYSHMLLCMELTTEEITFILQETRRVLQPGGLAVYSVRSNFDKHYQTGTPLRDGIYEIGGFAVHFFTEEKIREFSRGYEVLQITRMEEGRLPRDLFCVTMKATEGPDDQGAVPDEESEMSNPMDSFEAFMDAALGPGVLDHKTKQLVALGAALAAGCDP